MSKTTRRGAGVWLAMALIAGVFCSGTARAEEKTAQFQAYERLAKQFDQLRKTGAETMGPQELLTAAEGVIADLQDVIAASGGDPSAKSKSQRLLHKAYDFAGMAPESRQAYEDYLDTLETWQGAGYAAMAARREGDRMLKRKKDAGRAVTYYDILMVNYPENASKAHVLYNAGLASLETRAYEQATMWFDVVLEDEPESYYAPWALRKKAFAASLDAPADDDMSAALGILDELERRYSTPHWGGYVCYRRGYLLHGKGKLLEALAEYQKGMTAYPTSPYSLWSKQLAAQAREELDRETLDEMASEEEPNIVAGAEAPAFHEDPTAGEIEG